MRILRAINSGIVALLMLLPGVPAGAQVSEPQITDIAGDANGLNLIGVEQDSRPLSHDPADIRYVLMETTYEAIPVGDGIHHEPTGLSIHLGTTATPAPPDPVLPEGTPHAAYRLDVGVDGSQIHLEAEVYSDPGEPVTAVAWLHLADGCLGGTEGCWRRFDDKWTAVIDPERSEIVLHFPFSSLDAEEADLIGLGNTLVSPTAETVLGYGYTTGQAAGRFFHIERGAVVDSTQDGPDFVVGSDVPPDVPCTQGCP